MRILFWNTHKNKSINPYIASLVYDNDIEFPVGIESYGKIEYDGKTIKKVRLNVEKIANVFIKSLQSYERK